LYIINADTFLNNRRKRSNKKLSHFWEIAVFVWDAFCRTL